ncbi:hypothetical protein [Streptomyces sp. NPDC006691]|uniref:DUF7224 domain-containing protein n=1 Tax=Streptomyces sp. NPDC006691 TaxID=3364757 RepID=UPI003695B551
MRIRTMLRSSSAVIVLPILVVFLMTALGHQLTAGTTVGYWPSATGTSVYALPFIGTACAGMGAWEGARLTRGRVFDQAGVRSPLAVSASVLVPVLGAGVVACSAALALSAGSAGVGAGLPDVGILAVELALVLANTLAGFCLGRRLPALISVPVALVGAFVANAYPVAWSVLWLRHLVGGGLSGCCALDQVPDARAVWSALLFAGGLSAACGAVISRRRLRAAPVIALAVFVAGAGGAVATARGLGPDAARPRPSAGLVCERGTSATVCLWPEVADAALVRGETQQAVARLRAFGVATPTTFTMAARPAAREAKLGVAPDVRAEDVAPGVVVGLLPEPPDCARRERYPAGDAVGPVEAWLMLVAGAPEATVASRTPAADVQLAHDVSLLSQAEQLRWYEVNTAAMRTCSAEPQLGPVGGAR